MPNNYVEYGRIEYEILDQPKPNSYAFERRIVSGLIAGTALLSICSGVYEGTVIIGLIPFLWREELAKLAKDDLLMYKATLMICSLPSICIEQIVRDRFNLERLKELYFDNEDESEEDESETFKQRVITLAEQFGKLPAPDFSDYKREDRDSFYTGKYDEIARYFDEILTGTSFIKAEQELQRIDPRIALTIANKDNYFSNDEYEINFAVIVHDGAWTGKPSANTLILGSADIIRKEQQEQDQEPLVKFQYMAEYKSKFYN